MCDPSAEIIALLVSHVAQRSSLVRMSDAELALSAIVWRVGSIIELVAGKEDMGSLYASVAELQRDLRGRGELSVTERGYCDALDPDLAHHRDVVTHLYLEKSSWDFTSTSAHYRANSDALWPMASALSLAFSHLVAQQLWVEESPVGLFEAAQGELDW